MTLVTYHTLATVPLLEGLEQDDLKKLAPYVETHSYKQGETLFLQGDPGGALMIVASGEVELFIYDDHQNRVVLSRVGSGNFFGEVTLFDNSSRTANAIATVPTDVLVLRQDVMVAFLSKYPNAAIHIINVLSKRLRDANNLISSKYRDPFEVLNEKSNFWDRMVDKVVRAVGSWPYVTMISTLAIIWLILNGLIHIGWDPGPSFGILNISLVIIGAIQVPLVMMSQRRQEAYEHVLADMDHQVNLKAQLALMEVTRKLDRVQETLLDQAGRLERLERHDPLHNHGIQTGENRIVPDQLFDEATDTNLKAVEAP